MANNNVNKRENESVNDSYRISDALWAEIEPLLSNTIFIICLYILVTAGTGMSRLWW